VKSDCDVDHRFKCTPKWDLLWALASLNPSCIAIGFGLPHSVSVESNTLFLKARVMFVHQRLTAMDSVRFIYR
jgi:hypothetical protein